MNILNLFSGHTLLIGIILFLFLINLACIIYLVIRERKKDEEEIGEIITSLANAKPRDVEKPVIPEIEKEEVENMEEGNKARLEIDKVLEKMQKDLETTPEDAVASFEKEQEEKSIISYQELVDSFKKPDESSADVVQTFTSELKESLYDSIEEEKRKQKEESVRNTKPKEDFEEIDFSKEQWHKGNYLEEKEKKNAVRAIETFDFMADEPIEEAEIDVIDIEETMELPKEAFDIHQNEKKENRIPEKKKFQNTDFISPIYGKLDEKEMDYPTVRQFSRTNTLEELLEEPRKRRSKGEDSFSDTLDVSPLHSEIEKNDEFLQNLKDFRESL
jgi:hypothetical protein